MKEFKRKCHFEKFSDKHINHSYVKSKSAKKDDDKMKHISQQTTKINTIRLNKVLSNNGICSRRKADDLISKGLIYVNDKKVTELGYKVSNNDTIRYKNYVIQNNKTQYQYILLNKPINCVTTLHDPQCRRTVMDIIDNQSLGHLYPIGRLDRNTTGVLLLTNDGNLTYRLSHPSFEIKKIYDVELDKTLTISDKQKLMNGIKLEDGLMKCDNVEIKDDNHVYVTIHSGKNRIIRRLFEHMNYRIKSLDRINYAGITKKGLARGKWRYLSKNELDLIMNNKNKCLHI